MIVGKYEIPDLTPEQERMIHQEFNEQTADTITECFKNLLSRRLREIHEDNQSEEYIEGYTDLLNELYDLLECGLINEWLDE